MPSWYLNRKEDMKIIGIVIAECPDDTDVDTDELERDVIDTVIESQYFDENVQVKFAVAPEDMTLARAYELTTGISD